MTSFNLSLATTAELRLNAQIVNDFQHFLGRI